MPPLLLQAVARSRLEVPAAWLTQQHGYHRLVEDWLTALSPDCSLAAFQAHFALGQTQLGAAVMLLKQMAGVDQQAEGQLPSAIEQAQVSTFITSTLWAGLQSVARRPQLQAAHLEPLQQAAHLIQSCGQTACSKRYILLAMHKLIQCIGNDSVQHLHTALRRLVQLAVHDQPASSTLGELLKLLVHTGMPDAAAQSVQSLAEDLIQRIAQAQALHPGLKQELQSTLHAVFHDVLPIGKHVQEHLLMQLLSSQTLQPTNRVKRTAVRNELQSFAPAMEAEPRQVLLRMPGAELSYLPGIYGDQRCCC